MKENPLLGKTLTGMKIAADRQALLFQTTEGDIAVPVDADCCSFTWVESVELPALGFPALVTEVQELELPKNRYYEGDDSVPSSTFHPDSDCLQLYGCKISTDRGDIVIDYRNDSNGYYGGDLAWPGQSSWGRVLDPNSIQDWQELK